MRSRSGRARAEDAATLVALGAAVGREPEAWLLNTDGWRSVAEERRYLRALKRHPDAAVFVAEDDGAIVGRLSVARDPHPASRHVADLGLMVAASHRRRGIGRALLEQAVVVGARRGRPQARAARLSLERARDPALRAVRLRARGPPQAALPPRRRVRRRDPDGLLGVTFAPFVTYNDVRFADTLPCSLRSRFSSLLSAARGPERAERQKSPRLTAFGSCGQLLGYAKAQATRFVGPYGLGGTSRGGPLPIETTARASRPVAGVDFSGTNVQEEGVDEPDMVKTDGNDALRGRDGRLNAVDVREAKPRLLDSLELEPGDGELLLHGDRLLVLSRGGYWIQPLPAMPRGASPFAAGQERAHRDRRQQPEAAAARAHARARRLVRGGAARRRHRSHRHRGAGAERAAVRAAEGPHRRTRSRHALKQNKIVVAKSRATSWLPSYRIKRAGAKPGRERPLVQCRHVSRPPEFSGFGMLTVLTVDLAKGLEPVDSTSVMTDGRIVYASPESLYVATERWSTRPLPEQPKKEMDGATTRSTSSTSRARRSRTTAAAAASPATCSASGRSRSTRASCGS